MEEEEDDNIIPYETTPSLTVKQAAMYMLGYRGEYYYVIDTDEFEFALSDYTYTLQEEADSAFDSASCELQLLKRNGNASPEAIMDAEHRVEATKTELKKAQKLRDVGEEYRLHIDHEVSKVRLGKRSPIVVDEDESASTGQTRINTASFLKWFEGIELDDANEDSVHVKLPLVDDAFDKEMDLTRDTTESLFLTLGLLVSLFAESSGGEFGSALEPTVINIATKIDEYGKQLNKDKKLYGQGKWAIKNRINVALSALHSTAYTKVSL